MMDGSSLWNEQRLFRSIFEHARDALVIAPLDDRPIMTNGAARALGVDPAALLRDEAVRAISEGGATEVRAVDPRGRARAFTVHAMRHDDEHVVYAIRDVTDERATQRELRELRRVQALGLLTAGVVHDFNNLLTAITCSSAVLDEEFAPTSRAKTITREIRDAAERAARLVRSVLAFARRDHGKPEAIDVGAVISEMRALLARVAGEDVRLELDLDDGAGEAVVDREQLEHVILNLAANARDAMPNGGRLAISTARVTLGRDESHPDCGAAGAYVAITVADTGVGMTSEVRERIFERFFTTKRDGAGTGLGLASAHRFVAESGGCIAVRSEAGQGTTVVVYLPRVDGSPSSGARVSGVESPMRGDETVLLVDDEEHVRGVVRIALEELGYRVIDAPDGARALDLAKRHVGPIHLVLADLMMPAMNGRTLVERLRETGLRPRVLFMSGHPERAARDEGDAPILRKAFSLAQLARAVRKTLDR